MSGRSIAYRFLPSVAGKLPLDSLIRITGQRTIFPFYHLVSDDNPPHIKHLYSVRSVREFNDDIDLFLKHYKPVGLSDLVDSFNHGKKIPNGFLLSFDDGLREFHDVAAPILHRKGIPAVCFLNSAFIDNKDLFYRYKASLLIGHLQDWNDPGYELFLESWFRDNRLPYSKDYKGLLMVSYANRHLLGELADRVDLHFDEFLKRYRPYMDSTQVASLIRQGFSFGAHSIDHPEYRFLEEDEQVRQTDESIRRVAGKFGIREKVFSFPFTDFGVKRSFFDKVFYPSGPIADVTFGGAGLKQDSVPKNIQRIPFEGSSLTAKQILGTEYLYFMIKSIFGKNLIRR